jgi:nicotinate phosphoribosyltransferase
VYKLCAVENADGSIRPKIKISENPAKITTPHFKKVYRLFENETGKAAADLLCVHDEVIDDTKPLTIFHPHYTWKEKTLTNFTAVDLLKPIFEKGVLVYEKPTTEEIRKYCLSQIDLLWDEVKRFDNPHAYYVDLSKRLWEIKHDLLRQKSKG